MSVINRRAIFTIRNSLFRSPAAAARHLFNFNNGGSCPAELASRLYTNPRNWVDDIRKGAENDEDGTTGIFDDRRTKETTRDGSMDDGDDDSSWPKEGMRRSMEDSTRETADSVEDMAKEGAAKAMETGLELGEKVKQTMDIAWDGFKETTKNVTEAVAGDDDDHHSNKMGDYEPTHHDSHVDNLRKRAGGYDLRDKQ